MRKNKVWKFFCSIKLTVVLLTVIVAASVIGTVIPQDKEAAFYVRNYGRAMSDVLSALKLTEVYRSWWFIGLLFLFTINLLVCSFNRFSFKLRSMGFVIMHLSLVLILAGAMVGALWGEKGFVRIREGHTVGEFYDKHGGVHKMGFEMRLNDFIIERYDPLAEKLVVTVKDKNLTREYPVEIGKEIEVKGTDLKLKVVRYITDFLIDAQTKEVASRSSRPNNPAILVSVKNKERENALWLFARFPDMHVPEDNNLEMKYVWADSHVKQFKSDLVILDGGKVTLEKTIFVNNPLRYGGYTFYQASYDQTNLSWSGLQVTRDPGVPLIYTGFALNIVGLIFTFYIKPMLKRGRKE